MYHQKNVVGQIAISPSIKDKYSYLLNTLTQKTLGG